MLPPILFLDAGECLASLGAWTSIAGVVPSTCVHVHVCCRHRSWDKTIRVWDLNTLECVQVLEGHSEAVLALTVDGRNLVGGAGSCTRTCSSMRVGAVLCRGIKANPHVYGHARVNTHALIYIRTSAHHRYTCMHTHSHRLCLEGIHACAQAHA